MSALDRFREKMHAQKLDAFLVTQSDNWRYLSGFGGTAAVLLITPDHQFLVTDSRYYERVRQEAPDWTLSKAGYKTNEMLAQLLTENKLDQAKIGYEADYVTVSQKQRWQEAMPTVNFVDTTEFVVRLRAIKTEAELVAIRKAVAITDQAMAHIYTWIQPGMTEKAVAWEIELFMRTHGGDALAFDTIVAAGATGAIPHASPSDYVIQLGDVVVIDVGCKVDGYCADLTRTFSVGEPLDKRYQAVWEIVKQANSVATAGIKAGLTGKEADTLAREVIKEAGYGDYFGHSLGHGVGLAIHEYPRLSTTYDEPLETGSIITIEPGIYLPGAFGIRLEDLAVVTNDGLEVLTDIPKVAVLER
jgi:Xaa-Pro aminopeptidase